MESKLTTNEDSHGYGRFCVSCDDEKIGEIKCCRMTSYADQDLNRVFKGKDATFLVRHDVMACKADKGNPVLYKTDGIRFDDVEEIKVESSCEAIGTNDGSPSCKKGSCGFSTTASMRDKMADFTSRERHHVKCGIPDPDKPSKYLEKFDCCTKVTKGMKHPVIACQRNTIGKPKMYFTGKWDETDGNICTQFGEILFDAGSGKLSGFTKKEFTGKLKPYQGRASGGLHKFWYNVKALGINTLVTINPMNWKDVPLPRTWKMENIPNESGKERCGFSTSEILNRHME